MNTDWLKEICADEGIDIITQLHSIEIEGEQWTMATEGNIIVALRAHTERLATFPRANPTEWLKARADGQVLNFAELRAWVNPTKPKPCPVCGGSGLRVDTSFDDEEGYDLHFESDEALLCDFPLNLWMLRVPLAHVKAETVRVSHLTDHPSNSSLALDRSRNLSTINYPLLIDGGDWRIVIMAMRVELADLDKLPRFPA